MQGPGLAGKPSTQPWLFTDNRQLWALVHHRRTDNTPGPPAPFFPTQPTIPPLAAPGQAPFGNHAALPHTHTQCQSTPRHNQSRPAHPPQTSNSATTGSCTLACWLTPCHHHRQPCKSHPSQAPHPSPSTPLSQPAPGRPQGGGGGGGGPGPPGQPGRPPPPPGLGHPHHQAWTTPDHSPAVQAAPMPRPIGQSVVRSSYSVGAID